MKLFLAVTTIIYKYSEIYLTQVNSTRYGASTSVIKFLVDSLTTLTKFATSQTTL